MVRRCTSCKKVHHYPRQLCPFCFGDCAWEQASGKAKIYTISIMERANPPYAIGYVTLAEGPSVLTNFVDCDFKALKIGQDVKVTFIKAEGEGPTLPFFTPA
ncbi:Zn-ribbon domain-containing OB-fold protein [Acidisphaera sp. S103]|uniref:Zn-ribbon domain-containing OB-fold protein n=1 Tax=Acidisphaera sp. S103 TaxID=1747223 RepID=UPI00352E3CC8